MKKLQIAITGAGRMGNAIAQVILSSESLSLAAVWVREPAAASLELPEPVFLSDDLAAVISRADVVVDFSLPAATDDILAAIVRQPKPLVCGVSGLSDKQMAKLEQSALSVPVVYDRNMSQGIAVLDAVAQKVAESLGPTFNVEIEETHHVHKKDAPSGTALKLGATVAKARGQNADEIHYEVERRGEVPGDHAVIFTTSTERLVLSHSVTTRDVFAEGALRAAEWIANRPAGLYSMHDVLFADT